MERSIPQPEFRQDEPEFEPATPWARLEAWGGSAIVLGLGIALVCLYFYVFGRPGRPYQYIHFVWQAYAWLHGDLSVPIASQGGFGISYQDVMPILGRDGVSTGQGIIPFPPLPALVLLPFVALWGLATDQQAIAAVLGAVDVALAYWMLGALPVKPVIRVGTTIFLGLGTVLWYTAATGTTWWFAHLVAVACLTLAVGVALRADRGAAMPERIQVSLGRLSARGLGGPAIRLVRDAISVDGGQVLAGFLFGLAATARLTIVFGFPFFMLVGGGGNWARRTVSAAIGAAIPLVALLAYTQASTGHLFNPAYDYLYKIELGYTQLHYNPSWSIEDLRYVPQNVAIMLFNLPHLFPTVNGQGELLCAAGQARGFFDQSCPIAYPDTVGMSVLLTSPAFLVVPFAFRPLAERRVDRATVGAAIAVVAIAFVNLMHFSQGWVQFGYRFSNDFIPFALILVALAAMRLRSLQWFAVLVVVSIAVNYWGVQWGGMFGW